MEESQRTSVFDQRSLSRPARCAGAAMTTLLFARGWSSAASPSHYAAATFVQGAGQVDIKSPTRGSQPFLRDATESSYSRLSSNGIAPRRYGGVGASLTAACGLLLAGLGQRSRRQGNKSSRKAHPAPTRAEWNKRVTRIEGNRAVFEVTIQKPLGLVPQNFGNRPGVGVAKIKPDGNTWKHNNTILIDNEPGMFVLEGDEVVAVNGETCEGGDTASIGGLIKGSEGDTVTLKLARNYHVGPVKVVFEPGGHMITMKRGPWLRAGAEAAGADVKYGCRDGFCSSCWHAEESTMLIHRICRMAIPKGWDNVQPLKLLRSDEVRTRTGMSVYSLLQADGIVPPPPPGVDQSILIREMTRDREAGGNGKTMFSREEF